MNNKTAVLDREPSSLALYLSEIGHFRVPTDEEERELAVKAASGSKCAQGRLLLAALPQRESGILRLRYGIGKSCTYTLNEVGKYTALPGKGADR